MLPDQPSLSRERTLAERVRGDFARLWPAAGAYVLAVVLLTGCATTHAPRTRGTSQDLPPRVELGAVPFFSQEDYQCGPASLAMALASSGVPVRPEDLVAQVYSPARQGSLPTDMIGAARRHGRLAYPISTIEDVLAELAAGNPVVVLQDLGLWRPRWHFAVAIGYDLAQEKVVLHSGTKRREVLSFARFEGTWAPSGHWGLIVLPPGRLPATAKEQTFLEAAVGLERARQWKAAAEAYRSAHERWPTSLGALIGLGNSRYALRDLSGAEEAFRVATRLHPVAAVAFNNLAHVLAEMGNLEEALAAARQAVALGGALEEVYRATLLDIQGQRI